MMANLEPIPYPDQQIRRILERVKTIAMVGASSNWNRPSYFVMKYLQGKGYRVIPVNPGIAGQELLGEPVVWMQLGIRNDAAAAKAEAAGIEVIMNRCPKIEFGRLGGELSWSGVNSGIILNRPPAAPLPRRIKSRPAP